MKRILAFGWLVVVGSALQAQTINLRGKVSNGAGQPVADAVVELLQQGLKDTTGSDGNFSIVKPSVSLAPNSASPRENLKLENSILEFTVGEPSRLKIEVFDMKGNLLEKEWSPKVQTGVYRLNVASRPHSNQMLLIQASMGALVRTFRYLPSKHDFSRENSGTAGPRPTGSMLAKIAAAVDTLRVSAAGLSPKQVALSSFDSTVNITLEAAGPGSVPKVTAQNSTSIPASLGTPIPNPGKWNEKTYQAYYYNANGKAADIFLPPVKQNTPITKPVNVYTPPGYDPNSSYPYIVVMHGIGNHEDRFNELSQPKLVPFFDNLITSKATKPFIAVFPNGTTGGANNAAGYYAFGGELMLDLIPFLEANYSVRKDRASRAMAGFSFGGMQTINIGLCAHLKDFAWFAGLNAAGGNFGANDIAKYVAAQDPVKYPLHYFYISVGNSDGTAGSASAASANGLATKGPYITSANFSFQNNIPGGHTYPVAEVGLYNFLRMAFSPNY
jgi:enterochelin esterase-like enzyme